MRKQSCWGKVAIFQVLYNAYRSAIEPAKLHDLSNLAEWRVKDEFPFGLETHRRNKPPLFIVPVCQPVDQPIAPLLTRFRLERLRMNREAHRGILAMLRQCPNLTVLQVDYQYERDFDDIDEPICVLSKLEELKVGGWIPSFRFFYKIEAPPLRSLRSSSVWSSDDLARDLVALLRKPRFGAPLVCADVYFPDGLEADLESQLFQALSNIRNLTIYFKDDGDEGTYRLLSLDEDGGQLCPYLENIYILFLGGTSMLSIEQMLASRYRRSEKFRATIEFYDMDDYAWDMLEPIIYNPAGNFKRWAEQGRLKIE